MSRAHVVRQGEHLQGISARHGVDANEVWNAEGNRELRELRRDPQVLAPGDVLILPEPEPATQLMIEPRTTNRYVATMPKLEVAVRLLEGPDRPIANEPFEVEGLARSVSGTTEDDGTARFRVPAHLREARVRIPARDAVVVLQIGGLDPVDTQHGLRGALAENGFIDEAALDPSSARDSDATEASIVAALRRFQAARGLEETGSLDLATRDALEGR